MVKTRATAQKANTPKLHTAWHLPAVKPCDLKALNHKDRKHGALAKALSKLNPKFLKGFDALSPKALNPSGPTTKA